MSTILIIGESGSGKSTSLRNLDPETTFIINAKNKLLPFKNGTKKFSKNSAYTDRANEITSLINKINNSIPSIKCIILDDFQEIMTSEFMRSSSERGYDKFIRIGRGIWDILNASSNTRIDLKVFLLAHSESGEDGKIRCKTVGKLVNEKISIEGSCTIVLNSFNDKGKYLFATQNNGTNIAKSPIGMFEELMPNDLLLVIEKIDQYYSDEELLEIKQVTDIPSETVKKYLDTVEDDKLQESCNKVLEKYPYMKDFIGSYYNNRFRPADNSHLGEDVPQ